MNLFYIGYLVASNNAVVRTAYTDVLIITLANMEKLPAGINVSSEIVLHTNNTFKYVNVKKLHQAVGNSFCIALLKFSIKKEHQENRQRLLNTLTPCLQALETKILRTTVINKMWHKAINSDVIEFCQKFGDGISTGKNKNFSGL